MRDFPSCLVAEAVGQLAAWVAMSRIDFRGRPVAALATETRFHRDVRSGDALELGVEIADCDDHAVAYSGWARVDGATAIELVDCLGGKSWYTTVSAALAVFPDVTAGDGLKPFR